MLIGGFAMKSRALYCLEKNQKQKMADQIAMDPEKIMQQFQKQYPQSHLILTLGKKGSYYCDKKDILFQPAFEVKAIDTTAAGDTYSGYFWQI